MFYIPKNHCTWGCPTEGWMIRSEVEKKKKGSVTNGQWVTCHSTQCVYDRMDKNSCK